MTKEEEWIQKWCKFMGIDSIEMTIDFNRGPHGIKMGLEDHELRIVWRGHDITLRAQV